MAACCSAPVAMCYCTDRKAFDRKAFGGVAISSSTQVHCTVPRPCPQVNTVPLVRAGARVLVCVPSATSGAGAICVGSWPRRVYNVRSCCVNMFNTIPLRLLRLRELTF